MPSKLAQGVRAVFDEDDVMGLAQGDHAGHGDARACETEEGFGSGSRGRPAGKVDTQTASTSTSTTFAPRCSMARNGVSGDVEQHHITGFHPG